MVYQKKEFDFTLFINEGSSGNRPNYSGTIFINGQEVPIVGWDRKTKKGNKIVAGCKSLKKESAPTKDDWETHDASNSIPF